MNDKKNLISILKLLSVIVVLLVFLLTIVLVDNSSNKYLESNTKEVYAKVLSTYDEFILVKDIDDNTKYTVNTDDDYSVGDVLCISYLKDVENPKNIELIMSNKESVDIKLVDDVVEDDEDTTEVVTTTEETISTTTTEEIETTTTTAQVLENNQSVDSLIMNYAKNASVYVDNYVVNEDNKAKAKEYFCTLVDFIFYDGTINGHTFNELGETAKGKVIYYTILIDSKIDSKWPGYKDKIADKYNDVKAKLIAKYLDICVSVKTKEPELYEGLVNDFALLKKSVSLTWDIVKYAFNYAGSFTVSHLRDWYEAFRG